MAGSITANILQSDTTSPPTFRNNSVEIGQLCRAWVQFNGSNGNISGSFNVSSVVRTTIGNYTINFTNALPNANYAFALSAFNGTSTDVYSHNGYTSAPSTTQFKTYVYNYGGAPSDVAYTSAAFFSS